MKRLLVFCFFISCCICLKAQDYHVESVVHFADDMAAREEMKTDLKGRQCALLRIATKGLTREQREGFYFDCDYASYVVERRLVGGEIWLWVSPNIKVLKFYHTLGNIELHFSTFDIGRIESLNVYKIVIQGTFVNAGTGSAAMVRQQFLLFQVTPKDARVTVKGIPWPVIDGVAQKMVDFGEYEYRIEAPDYHTKIGKVTVDDAENKVMETITLNPAYGFLKIEGDMELLSQASIYLDNSNGTEALRSSMRLGSGKHQVSIVHPMYKPYQDTVTIVDGQTFTLKVNLAANYSTVTLQVEDEAEIFVNGEKKGVGSWTGNLESGVYLMETRKECHNPSVVRQIITDDMSGQTITLQPPTPLVGRLVVSSTPPIAQLFVDDKWVGETPMQLNSLIVGSHTVRIEKAGCAPVVKTITIEEGKTLTMEEKLDIGRTITVKTDRDGDLVFVDGRQVGVSPVEVDLDFGKHVIHAERDEKYVDKEIEVLMKGGETLHVLTFRGETVTRFAERGVNYTTLNFANSMAPQISCGATFGQVKRVGWFVTAMSNFDFRAMNLSLSCDNDGLVDGEKPLYSGESFSTRISVIGGLMVRVAGPFCLRFGAGYGLRNKAWQITDGSLVKVKNNSFVGVDATGGLQLIMKGFTVSLDAVSTNFKTMEVKLGLGYCWKRRGKVNSK